MEPRLAIIGSCVTRDIWNLPTFRPEDRKALFMLARTSLASLFAEPLGGFSPPDEIPAGLSPWEIRMVGHDLEKTGLAGLVAHRPTHLVLDLIDERFDLLRRGEVVVARSWETHLLGLHDGLLDGFERIPRRSVAAGALWRRGLERLAGFLAAELPQTLVIIHDARCAIEHVDLAGSHRSFDDVWEFWPGEPASIDGLNATLGEYVSALRDAFPRAACVRAPDALAVGDARHRWGLAPFHYLAGYYEFVWREFARLGCG